MGRILQAMVQAVEHGEAREQQQQQLLQQRPLVPVAAMGCAAGAAWPPLHRQQRTHGGGEEEEEGELELMMEAAVPTEASLAQQLKSVHHSGGSHSLSHSDSQALQRVVAIMPSTAPDALPPSRCPLGVQSALPFRQQRAAVQETCQQSPFVQPRQLPAGGQPAAASRATQQRVDLDSLPVQQQLTAAAAQHQDTKQQQGRPLPLARGLSLQPSWQSSRPSLDYGEL